MRTYSVVEIFYSLQGEGHHAGMAYTFVRFAGCNLQCTAKEMGFNCDTDFRNGTKMTGERIAGMIESLSGAGYQAGDERWVCFTGGEPTLQLDEELIGLVREMGYKIAVETNGLLAPPWIHDMSGQVDWVACSPKRGTEPQLARADEVRVVLRDGESPDPLGVEAHHFFVSPAAMAPSVDAMNAIIDQTGEQWEAGPQDLIGGRHLRWAIQWVGENPRWRLSVQAHKLWGIR